MNKEDFFIKQFEDCNIIGDDGAVIGENVYSMDAFFENVHFKREWMSLKQIAKKAMLVNISDAIVMNARPKYALLSVAIPKDFTEDDLEELSSGFKSVAKDYGIKIIGGDTISNEKLDISITIISKTKKPVLRSGAKVGDILCYTNDIGSVKKDLEKLMNGQKVSKTSKFIKPRLNPKFFYEAAKYMTSAMDISDGLFFELEKISKQSKVDFKFFEKIDKAVGCSGEEYEVVFSYDKKNEKKIQEIAKKHNIRLNIFAKVVRGKYECKCKGHHF